MYRNLRNLNYTVIEPFSLIAQYCVKFFSQTCSLDEAQYRTNRKACLNTSAIKIQKQRQTVEF